MSKNNTNNQMMIFDEDKKANLLKSTKDLIFAAQQIHEWAKSDSLSQEMAGILPSLIESHFVDVAKIVDYQSNLTQENEQRHIEIRTANEKIRELKQQLGSSKPIDGLKEQLISFGEIIRDWWNLKGFNYTSELNYTENGHVEVEFGFMLDHISMLSTTPVSDKKSRKERLEIWSDEGYDIVYGKGGRDPELKDNDNNRQRVIDLIISRFPSAKITEFKNHYFMSKDCFVLRKAKAYIRNLHDIPNGLEKVIEEGDTEV